MIDIEFTKEDYENMRFNPEGMNKRMKAVKVWPELFKFPEISRQWDPEHEKKKDRFLIFCLYMYDRESPFVKHYQQEVAEKRLHAAMKAGFDLNMVTGQFYESDEILIIGKYEKAADFAVRIMRILGGREWTSYNILSEKVYDTLAAYRTGTDIDFGQIDKAMNRLNILENELMKHDNSEDIRRALYKHQMNESLKLRPEDIAKRLHDQEKLEDPYRL
jgi:hypothetical protein